MTINRRLVIAGLGATWLAGCGGTPGDRGDASPLPADLRPQSNRAYDAWVAAFRGRATSQGISAGTFDAAFREAGFLPGVVTRDRSQTEFTRSLEDYLAIAASDERITKGRAALTRHASTLAAIEARFGVDRHILTAIWGLESFYGERQGKIPVISATSTLAFEGRRGAFFEAQTLDALRILQAGDITPARMTGSWAGAMGHTPVHPDHLHRFLPWISPATGGATSGRTIPPMRWQAPPITLPETAGNAGWPGGAKTRAAPCNPNPAVRGSPQRAISGRSSGTTIPIPTRSAWGHLADRIAGGGPLRASFPPDRYGLAKDDRIALQRGLTRRGFDAGDADGVIGSRTTAAIEAFQRARGLAVTGTPSQALLRAL